MDTLSVTGQPMDTLGQLSLSLRIGTTTVSHTFQVVRGVSRKFLLGWDFFCAHRMVINLRNGTAEFNNESLPLVHFPRDVPGCCNVQILSPVTLPASSETNIAVKLVSPIHGYFPNDYVGLFEPDYGSHNFTIAMARTLSPAYDGQITVRIMNPTNDDINLYPGTRIGHFHSVSDDGHGEYTLCDSPPSSPQVAAGHSAQKSPLPPVDLSEADISPAQLHQLENLLRRYANVFSTSPNDYGRTEMIRHRIRTGDVSPLRQRAYRSSPVMKTEIHKQIQTLLDNDIIEESHSPWSSPIVMVKKKDGTYRFCVDYRKLNKVTIKDSHPLPRTDDTLDALSGSVYFTKVDLSSGYWQVAVHPHDREKTAFTTGDGLYHFNVMPMGLTNAPPTFQRLMELALHGLHWSSCLVYLDDVIVVGNAFSDHMANLEQVLSRFQRANLKLKPSKCHFLRTEVCFQGWNVVSRDGILPDPTNTDRVHTWPIPVTLQRFDHFLAFVLTTDALLRTLPILLHHSTVSLKRVFPTIGPPSVKQHSLPSVMH